MINLLVSGGRDYPDRARVFAVLDVIHEHSPVAELRHGACGADLRSVPTGTCDTCYQARIQVCRHVQDAYYARILRGADRWADEWAHERGIPCRRCPSDWSGQGRAAGMRRNGTMLVEEPPVDLVVCFPGGPGTAGMARLAATAGVPVLDLAAEEPLPAKVCIKRPPCAGCGKTMFVLGDTRELCAGCVAKAPRRVPDMALRAEMAKIAKADAREIRGWAGKDMTDLHRLAAMGRLVPAGMRSDGTPRLALDGPHGAVYQALTEHKAWQRPWGTAERLDALAKLLQGAAPCPCYADTSCRDPAMCLAANNCLGDAATVDPVAWARHLAGGNYLEE